MVEYLLSNEQFYLIVMLFVWVIILELAHSSKAIGLCWLQFAVSMPLVISLCSNAFLQSIAYGYMLAFTVLLVSAYYVFIGLANKIK